MHRFIVPMYAMQSINETTITISVTRCWNEKKPFCLKSIQSQFLHKRDLSGNSLTKVAQTFYECLGYFCMRIFAKIFHKTPNLVTLLMMMPSALKNEIAIKMKCNEMENIHLLFC